MIIHVGEYSEGEQSEGKYSKGEQSWSGSETIVCHHQKREKCYLHF